MSGMADMCDMPDMPPTEETGKNMCDMSGMADMVDMPDMPGTCDTRLRFSPPTGIFTYSTTSSLLRPHANTPFQKQPHDYPGR
jgi:hypothetical protein